jgi:DNA polymerase III alpha subunit
VGLSRVFGLHRATADRIVAARAERPFASLADLSERARPSLPELESLIIAGALDGLQRTRPSLLLEARAGARAWTRPRGAMPALAHADGRDLAPPAVAPVAVPELPEFGAIERVRNECAATGLWFSGHPLDALPAEAGRGATLAASLEHRAGGTASVVGLACAYRRVETRSGAPMLFLTLADRTGLAECVLFPDVYARFASVVNAGALRATGRVGETLGAVTLEIERLEPLGEPLPFDR